jgi:hypothetical protein
MTRAAQIAWWMERIDAVRHRLATLRRAVVRN